MQCLNIALKTFRIEIVSRGTLLSPGTIWAGVILCPIYASPPFRHSYGPKIWLTIFHIFFRPNRIHRIFECWLTSIS